MLMDKGYHDFDYEKFKKKRVLTEEDKRIWSREELAAVLGNIPGAQTEDKPSAQEVQSVVMKEIKEHKNARQDGKI